MVWGWFRGVVVLTSGTGVRTLMFAGFVARFGPRHYRGSDALKKTGATAAAIRVSARIGPSGTADG